MTLKDKLFGGRFVVTAELNPPKGSDVRELIQKVHLIKGLVDAVNLTDNNRAVMCMSSVAGAALVYQNGIEPILQLTCRDRNRMALQSDLLGAHALGVRNVLALTGDPVKAGDHPEAKEVFDLDSLQLMKTLCGMNEGVNFVGKELNEKTEFFIGAAANPGAKDLAIELSKFKAKIDHGAHFFQTQGVYDVASFQHFMQGVNPYQAKVIAGIILLKSAKMARFLNEKVPGILVPDDMIERLEKSSNPESEGVRIAGEIIQSLKGISHGVHLMCIGREDLIPKIMEHAGIE